MSDKAISVDPQVYRALSIRQGLKLYARTGMKPNRAWTPSAMLKAASDITGIVYKRGQYEQAAQDIADQLLIGRAPNVRT